MEKKAVFLLILLVLMLQFVAGESFFTFGAGGELLEHLSGNLGLKWIATGKIGEQSDKISLFLLDVSTNALAFDLKTGNKVKPDSNLSVRVGARLNSVPVYVKKEHSLFLFTPAGYLRFDSSAGKMTCVGFGAIFIVDWMLFVGDHLFLDIYTAGGFYCNLVAISAMKENRNVTVEGFDSPFNVRLSIGYSI